MRASCPHSRNHCPGGIVRRSEWGHEHLDTHPDHDVSVALRGRGRRRTGRGTCRERCSTRCSTCHRRRRTGPPSQWPLADLRQGRGTRGRRPRPTTRARRPGDSRGAARGRARHYADGVHCAVPAGCDLVRSTPRGASRRNHPRRRGICGIPRAGSCAANRWAGAVARASVQFPPVRSGVPCGPHDRASTRTRPRAGPGASADPRSRFRSSAAAGDRSERGGSAGHRDHGPSRRRERVGGGAAPGSAGTAAVTGGTAACAVAPTTSLSRCGGRRTAPRGSAPAMSASTIVG
ncbi:hypothetical protein ATK86_4992 [Nocardia fluminea]|uniref:Uncharacterized protein n=1 Tax=Nocardia fluminea TaxID=134984 RepID=A0A2N3VG15_9NOCA|nr:hypothetical protein ATK86_4992 [Nocardia fluminea]